MASEKSKGFLAALGPGLLFAGTSVGVSELVQSTRAGADYSFGLLAVIALACFFKYPAFAFGPWYAHATGVSLLEGFWRQGKWALVAFLLLTLGTVFTVQAVVTVVSASILVSVLGLKWSSPDGINVGPAVVVSAGLLLACAALLRIGHYKWLDSINKVLIFLLTISTVIATILALTKLNFADTQWVPPQSIVSDPGQALRVTGLVGWTPSAYDVAIWHSMWFLAHKRESGHVSTLREARLDFNIGYWFSSFTSLCFLTLGACLMFHRDIKFPGDAVGFANALVGLYASTFGEWARPVLGICAFSAMFSTVLSVTDSFPRVFAVLVERFKGPESPDNATLRKPIYWSAMAAIGGIAVGILMIVPATPKSPGAFSFKTLLDVATTLSFLSAPFLGVLIHRAMFSREVGADMRPGGFLRGFSIVSILFNLAVAGYFIRLQFFS